MPTITQPELFFVNNFSCLKPYNRGCKVMVMNTLGKRLKFARERLFPKVSQKTLGERVGRSQQMIGKLENDQSEETAAIVRIATELGIRPEWLETGQGLMTGEASPRAARDVIQEIERRTITHELGEAELSLILDLVKRISSPPRKEG
ncbi:MAG: helix-turn-helix domain-containing protein [Candidatus Contendobacter sp.]|nr:helix-turn-helix domain-containing protein [Candidatus Contendobacter sp.]